jgi:hypothetical protein
MTTHDKLSLLAIAALAVLATPFILAALDAQDRADCINYTSPQQPKICELILDKRGN